MSLAQTGEAGRATHILQMKSLMRFDPGRKLDRGGRSTKIDAPFDTD
jgi:hypothetical protein